LQAREAIGSFAPSSLLCQPFLIVLAPLSHNKRISLMRFGLASRLISFIPLLNIR
jgi:hypothetical protein